MGRSNSNYVDPGIVANVPGYLWGRLEKELKQARLPYQVERYGKDFVVQTVQQAKPIVDSILGSQPGGGGNSYRRGWISFAIQGCFLNALAVIFLGAAIYGLMWMGQSPANNQVGMDLLRREYLTGPWALLFYIVVGLVFVKMLWPRKR